MTDSSDTPSTPDQLRADIERTRAELADSVDALSAKLDVKGRAADKVDGAKHRVEETATRAKKAAPASVQQAVDKAAPYRTQLAAGAGGLLVVVLVVRRFRRRRG